MTLQKKILNSGMLMSVLLGVFVLGAAPALCGQAVNGTQDHLTRIEVNLVGMDRFGGVQLFDYLLKKMPEVVSARQVSLRLLPDDPDGCSAAWSVYLAKGDGATLQKDLLSVITKLDPNKQNDILYEAPFIVIGADLDKIKQVAVLEHQEDSAWFYVAGVDAGRVADLGKPRDVSTEIPWYKLPGVGFE